MRYGYFDIKNREYVIEKPDTPVPWMNYLHNEEYCALISNNAGGYSFHLSARDKRILRYRLNNVPMDRPGRYLYIKDLNSGEFWSASWQPVLKELSQYKTETRHGFGYTRILSNYNKIESSTLYVVPITDNLEIWSLTLKNNDSIKRKLKIFSYAELCLWAAQNDMMNFQYTYNIAKAFEQKGAIHHLTMFENAGHYAFFGSSGQINSFDCDREKFLGLYHSEASPIAVEKGQCSNSTADGGNPIAATEVSISLNPKETKVINYVLGVSNSISNGLKLINQYKTTSSVQKVMVDLKKHWDEKLESLKVETPDEDVNLSLNQWNAYQVHTTFSMSRGPSIYEGGIGRGMGFRDSNQDLLGIMHSIPQKAKKLILDLAKNMFKDGTSYHQFFRLTGEGDGKGFSDDPLWIILSTIAYIKETGHLNFLNEKVEWADGGKATMYDHLKAPLEYTFTNVGRHQIPKMGFADWNDTLHINGPNPGESVWVAHFFVKCAKDFSELAEIAGKHKDALRYKKLAEIVSKRINDKAWDGEWYIRAFDGWGKSIGSKKSQYGKIYLNAQSWSVISGVANHDRGIQAMNAVKKFLDSEHGIALLYPGYKHFDPHLGGISTFPPGLKENGGIFCHANPWAVIAETLLNRPQNAFKYYKQLLPPVRNRVQEIHKAEPYVYAQSIASREHRDFGLARNSWLTGTASWNYIAGTQYILGIQPDYKGLRIQPCFSPEWKEYKVWRIFRGAKYEIVVRNFQSAKQEHQKLTIKLDGKVIDGNLIPVQQPNTKHRVEVEVE